MKFLFENFSAIWAVTATIGLGLISYLFFCEKKYREYLQIKHDLDQINNKIENGSLLTAILPQEKEAQNKLIIERNKLQSEIKLFRFWLKLNWFKRFYS